MLNSLGIGTVRAFVFEEVQKKYPQTQNLVCRTNRLLRLGEWGSYWGQDMETILLLRDLNYLDRLNSIKELNESQDKIIINGKLAQISHFRSSGICAVLDLSEESSITEILEEIARLKRISPDDSFNYLCEIYNVGETPKTIRKQERFLARWFDFIDSLNDGRLEQEYPYLYQYVKLHIEEIRLIMPRLVDYTVSESGDYIFRNYHSNNSLSVAVTNESGITIPSHKVRRVMTALAVLEIYQKQESEWIFGVLSDVVRYKNYILPTSLTRRRILNANEIARRLLDKGINFTHLSFDSVYREFGEEKAHKDFNQIRFYLNTNEGSNEDPNISKQSVRFEKATRKYLTEQFETNNYVIERDMIKILSRSQRVALRRFERTYKKFRHHLIDDLDLAKVSLNKNLQESLGIEGKYARKAIIVRKEENN